MQGNANSIATDANSIATAALTRDITMTEKTSRGTTRKGNLTKGTGPDRDGVKSQLDKLKVPFTIFEQAHETYHHTLADGDDIENSAEYFS